MKQTIRLLTLALAGFLLAGPITESVAAPVQTGIQGQTFLYIVYGQPIGIPPVWIGILGVQLPVATTLTVLSSTTGHEVGRVATDADGTFALPLHPGKYLLVADTLTMAGGCSVSTQPVEVIVRARQVTTANVFYFRKGPCSLIGTMSEREPEGSTTSEP